ncbi:diguanylate cyclase [Clostridium carnis]
MYKLDLRKRLDIILTITIGYFFFLAMVVSTMNFKGTMENYIMLTSLMIVAIIAYYTDITSTLLITLIADFVYSSYNLYESLRKGIPIGINVYFWIVAIPLTAAIMVYLSRVLIYLQDEVILLKKSNRELKMIDELTGIRNIKAFINDIPIYISMNRRYKLPVTLMVVRFKYSDQLKRVVGKKNFKDVLVEVSENINNCLRVEDRKYILDENTFGYILITNELGSEVVKDRVKKRIKNIDFKNNIEKNIKIDIEVGFYECNGKEDDPLEIIENAKRELEYDF